MGAGGILGACGSVLIVVVTVTSSSSVLLFLLNKKILKWKKTAHTNDAVYAEMNTGKETLIIVQGSYTKNNARPVGLRGNSKFFLAGRIPPGVPATCRGYI